MCVIHYFLALKEIRSLENNAENSSNKKRKLCVVFTEKMLPKFFLMNFLSYLDTKGSVYFPNSENNGQINSLCIRSVVSGVCVFS